MVIAELYALWQIPASILLAYLLLWAVTLIARAHDERKVRFIYIALLLLPLVVIGFVAIS